MTTSNWQSIINDRTKTILKSITSASLILTIGTIVTLKINNSNTSTLPASPLSTSSPHDTPLPTPHSSSNLRRHLTPGPLGVAWLMSFPNSGTTYTERLIESVTQYTVATNYGHEHVNDQGEPVHILTSVPVFEGGKNGPFRLSDRAVPVGGYILTKTHCGGYCFSDCPPNWFILTPEQYLEECIRGARFEEREGGTSERFWVQYDPSFAKRAVHLYRDPFDNIVSRFHHEYKTHRNQKDEEWLGLYPNDPQGFRRWCRDTDERNKEKEPLFFSAEMREAFEGVLCHGEFYRWVQWHNNAFAVAANLNIPVHVVHYADYGTDFDNVVNGILDFVNLEWKGQAPPFGMLAYEEGYYSKQEREQIVTFMKYMASDTTWTNMLRYVQNYTHGTDTVVNESVGESGGESGGNSERATEVVNVNNIASPNANGAESDAEQLFYNVHAPVPEAQPVQESQQIHAPPVPETQQKTISEMIDEAVAAPFPTVSVP